MAGVPRTEPATVRLDEALAEMRAGTAPEAAQRAAGLAEAWLGLDPIDTVVADPAPERGRGARGLDALLLDAAMPRLRDPGVLQPERLLALLAEIAALVASENGPGDADAGPLAAVGAAMIEEERAKYRLLLGLTNALIEA